MSFSRFFTLAAVAAAGLLVAGEAAAQTFPSRPLKLVVPASAGGSADAVGRIVAEGMSKVLGQPVVVENIASAASVAGTNYVVQSQPDGYTILISSSSIVILDRPPLGGPG